MKKAFTLLELLIVIIIIGILASMAIPRYTVMTSRARSAEAAQMLAAMRGSMERYGLLKSAYPIDGDTEINLLDIGNPNDNPNSKFQYCIAEAYNLYAVYPSTETCPVDTVTADCIEMDQDGAITGYNDFANFF